ncbi:MAG: DUF1559 domain-containing protein [Gemmataceae bacterium]
MSLRHKARPRRRALSLIELTITVGLLGVLAGLTLSAVQRSRDAAARVRCQNSLKQLATALHNHHAAHGRLPPLTDLPTLRSLSVTQQPEALLSWMAQILPYVERDDLWRQSVMACAADRLPYHNPPHIGYATPVAAFVCPSDDRLLRPMTPASGHTAAFHSYPGVEGAYDSRGLLPGVLSAWQGIRLSDVNDGTANTLMVGERPPPDSLQAGRWYSSLHILERFGGNDVLLAINEPMPWAQDEECARALHAFGPGVTDNPCDRYHFWSLHAGGANFAFADGSVRFLPYTARSVMVALASRDGGETVEIP